MERPDRRARPDRAAIAGKAELPPHPALRTFRVEVHEPHRLLRRAPARPGDPGDGDGDVRAEPRTRTLRHRGRNLRRDGTVPLDQLWGNVELLPLDLVR